ncbi:diheme cytochrome c [Saccharospirillum salsuginis]|uniref:Diacylglycerol kinase n=1 Tax=Saccharospirillum salsuginis TaxID=418750 RepID=A0A918N4Z3_9GAMM|nr:diheme cytochrome c [Saccharospirillum salsuginis]GGX39798.1 diacylglycerol kinase [Saccharospirillum salsuginis]
MNERIALWRWYLGTVLLGGALGLGIIGLASADGVSGYTGEEDEDRWEEDYDDGRQSGLSGTPGAGRELYRAECSACHLAYPAGLLPRRSWQALMSGLDNHFGENAELLPDDSDRISNYLLANAADTQSRVTRRFLRGLTSDETPLRVTDTPFFKRQHREIPDRRVTGNPEVGGFSQCQACHGDAAQRGVFDEDTVVIPGYGRWDD